MRYTVHKLFAAWDFEKEEQWLNEMSAKGLELVSIGWCKYIFKDGNKNEYKYRIELLENLPAHAESISYIRFLEDMGIEHIGSFFRWVYFRKKTQDGDFDIYSDIDSKIKHYRRISVFVGILGLANLMPAISNAINYFNNDFMRGFPIFILNGVVAVTLITGYFILLNKIIKLKKDKQLYE